MVRASRPAHGARMAKSSKGGQMTSILPALNLQLRQRARATGTAAFDVITPGAFDAAVAEITQWDGYAPTPLVSLPDLASRAGLGAIHYKHEGPRFGLGSFKALGGAYAALCLLQRKIAETTGTVPSLQSIRDGEHAGLCADITLVSATDGNHGRSLAWGAARFGAPCRIYIHAEVSEGRAHAMQDLGATVIRIDGDYDASVVLAQQEADANGWFVVSDTSWPGYTQPPLDVMSGYGVMVDEICAEMDTPPTHVFLQGGVGGLAAGVAARLRQKWGARSPRVVVVEPDRAACLFESARAGAATNVQIETETIMAGLSCGEPSPLAWDILREEAGDFLTIPDGLVGPSVRLLATPPGADRAIEAGESAVAGLAAALAAMQDKGMAAQLGLDGAARVLLIGSEGVTDPAIFALIMEGQDAL